MVGVIYSTYDILCRGVLYFTLERDDVDGFGQMLSFL